MNCLVTGAAGYIGKAIVRRLIKERHNVIGLIHNKKLENPEKNVKYIIGNVADINTIKNLEEDIDIIFHCAAYVKDYGPKELFYKVNYEGTKNIVDISKRINIKKFIYIGHIDYERKNKKNFYSITKELTEKFLVKEYKKNSFPVYIIRPGNVFGPEATTWVLRIIEAIKKNRILLINNGKGIFHHTYIDNLLDALMASINIPKGIGEIIDITDGDNNTTWRDYFNDLAKIIGKNSINKNISKNSALTIGKIMLILNKIFKIEPWITPSAVDILTNNQFVSIKKARELLDYNPIIDYDEGINRIEKWYEKKGILNIY